MKNLMKRSAAALLALIMCVGMLNLTAFAADVEPTPDVAIGNCKFCNGPILYSGVHDANGYGVYCGNCGSSYQVPTIGTYQPSEPTTGNFCPQCYEPILVVEPMDDTYCWQKHCPGCGYDDKPTHDFGSDGDSEACMNGCGYKNPNYKPLPAGVYPAQCGGTFKYDEATGFAVGITKGTNCVDINKHDHQCDYCHAEMFEGNWEVVEEPTCTKPGLEKFECSYEGCNAQQSTRPINALGHDFKNQSWDDGELVENAAADTYKDRNGNEFKFNPDEAILYKYTRPCIRKDATETAYEQVAKGAQPIHVEYVLDEAYNGMAAGSVISKQDNVTELKPGEKTTIKPNNVPGGYELYDDSDAYAAGQPVSYTDAPSQTVQFRIKPIYCQWQIKYVYKNGGKAAEDAWINFTLADLGKVSKDSPVIDGYTPDQVSVGPKSQDDMVNKFLGNAIIVTYKAINYTLVINYVDADGGRVLDSKKVGPVHIDDTYSEESPSIPNYELAEEYVTVSGTVDEAMIDTADENNQIVIKVPYTKLGTYLVQWVNWNGNLLASVSPYKDEAVPAPGAYSGTTPTRGSDGTYTYAFRGWSEPEVNEETGTVTYTALFNSTLIYNPPVTSEPVVTPTPTPSPEPSEEVEVTEPVTPLDPLPELPEEPELPELPEEPIEVEDPETPLGPLPELPEEPVEVEVEDPDVPLANVPQTGDNTALWVTTAVVSGTGLIWLAVDGRKRREDAE